MGHLGVKNAFVRDYSLLQNGLCWKSAAVLWFTLCLARRVGMVVVVWCLLLLCHHVQVPSTIVFIVLGAWCCSAVVDGVFFALFHNKKFGFHRAVVAHSWVRNLICLWLVVALGSEDQNFFARCLLFMSLSESMDLCCGKSVHGAPRLYFSVLKLVFFTVMEKRGAYWFLCGKLSFWSINRPPTFILVPED